jgi:metal-sulfur cluster biosynthetic enzyme
LPNLEDSFFKSKAELFKASKDLLESVRKFLAGDQKALQIKIPLQFEAGQITETITKDVQKLNQVIGSLQPLKLTTQGDFKEVINQLGVLNNKEITLTINQEGDVEKIAKQLADLNLRGVQIPIVIEQQGDIKKIAEQLSKLKAVDIKITGDAQKVLTDLSKIKDVSVSVKLDQTGALDKLTELTKGKQLPIFINEDGIITQITRAVDGAIKVVQTRAIRVPVITEADIKIAENLSKEIELSQAILDNFFKSVERDVRVPVNLIPDPTLSKQAIDDINKKLNLKEQFKIFGDLGLSEFEKIDFTNINRGIAEATDRLRGMFEVANTLNQAIGQGLVGAFNSVFDAILEGKNVFKALANGIKDLIIQTIKAVAQMLILRAVTSFLFPGAGAGGFSLPKGQFVLQANPGNTGFGGIGSRAFTNTLNVVVTGQISNQSILLAGQRALGSNSR